MKLEHLAGIASALFLAGPAHAAITAEHYVATGPNQDTPYWFGSLYQTGEIVVFEGLIENNALNGSSEITLWESPKTGGTIRDSDQAVWSTTSGGVVTFVDWDFSFSYTDATKKFAYSLTASGQSPIAGEWTATSPLKPLSDLTDIVIRARPRPLTGGQVAGDPDTQVSLTDLKISRNGGVAENIVNPTLNDNKLIAPAVNPLTYTPVQFLFLDNALTPGQDFNITGKAQFSWQSPLVGGVNPINGANLAFEFKLGSFTAVPEGDALWAALPLASAAGFWACRRARRA